MLERVNCVLTHWSHSVLFMLQIIFTNGCNICVKHFFFLKNTNIDVELQELDCKELHLQDDA